MSNDKKLTRSRPMPDLDAVGGVEVKLGDETYGVVPQRIGYLRSKLGVALGNIGDLDLNAGNVLDVLGGKVHDVLNVFIPDLMPDYEFQGFATREAMEAGEYQEEYDHSPSPPEVRAAFTAVARINEIDLLKHLGNLIGPEVIRAYIAGNLADSLTTNLESLSATSGDTPSMTSGTPVPTSESTEG